MTSPAAVLAALIARMIVCSKCGEKKASSQFGLRGRGTAKHSWCHDCKRAHDRAYQKRRWAALRARSPRRPAPTSAPASDEAWIAEVMARCEAATASPWQDKYGLQAPDDWPIEIIGAVDGDANDDGTLRLTCEAVCEIADTNRAYMNAEFIIHAREDLPRALVLAKEAIEARARIAALEHQVATLTRERDESDAVTARHCEWINRYSGHFRQGTEWSDDTKAALARHRAKSQEGETDAR